MYTIWTGEETVVYVDGDQNGLAKGKLVSFDPSADQTYTQDSTGTKDFTILDGSAIGKGVKIAVTDYSESDKTITFANGLKVEGNAYVETSKTTKALDDDAQIVYIDADDNKVGDSGVGITEFDGTTGYANALVVYDGNNASNKIVAVIVNTNSDVDVLGNKNVWNAMTVAHPTVTGNTTGIVATANKTSAVAGETIKVTVALDATATASSVTVSATNGTVTPAAAQAVAAGHSYTFDVVVGNTGTPVITVTAA